MVIPIKNSGIHYGRKSICSFPDYYLDAIEALIPKPPKPIIMAEKGAIKK